MFNRERLLSHIRDKSDREMLYRILDKAEITLRSYRLERTDFLDPRQLELACGVLKGLPDIEFTWTGGFPGAERQRLLIIPKEAVLSKPCDDGISFLEIRGNFNFVKVDHRDFLGAVLAHGIKREKLGDLLVGDGGCQLVCDQKVAPFLIQELSQVHQVTVQVREISPEQLRFSGNTGKDITASIASLRLDAVVAAGFHLSRGKSAKEITAGNVKLNWQVVTNPSKAVKPGDSISCRGLGKLKIGEVLGETRKGRWRLRMTLL